jgi:hypothetical protein
VTEPDRKGLPYDSRVPGQSTSSGITMGSKPDFETVYRRTAATAPAATVK